MNFKSIPFLVFLIAIQGCVTIPQFSSRYAEADRIAATCNFKKNFIKTKHFILTSYYRFNLPGKPITIYIEGDGVAWETKRRLSADPTPRSPLVLRFVSTDSSANVAYLARPGQYSSRKYPTCDPLYWSDKRFSEEVIDSMDQAIDSLAKKASAKNINLIAYSGGAAVAVLVAARRDDVSSLRTIAGNLDHIAVNKHHKVSPMKESLNPIDAATKIAHIPQYHFVGQKDKIVPLSVTKNFVNVSGNPPSTKIIVIKGVAHADGWLERWSELRASSTLNDG